LLTLVGAAISGGDPKPSSRDLTLTKQLVQAARMLDLHLVDLTQN
jgi:DNA repair protein RadC